MSRGKSLDEGRRRDSRAWLGPPGQGGERLARVLGIGSSSEPDVGRTLEELRASLIRLEAEVDDLALIMHRKAQLAHSARSERPRVPQTSDRDYWLSRCDHFTVYAGERVVGAVEGMRFRSRVDRPDLLEVRCGHLGRRLLLIPVDEVAFVEPRERLVVLHTGRSVPEIRERVRSRLDRLRMPPRVLPH